MDHNSPDVWNIIWSSEGRSTWRGDALENVYSRIVKLAPDNQEIADLGGGVGILGSALHEAGKLVTVYDHSRAAVAHAREAGLRSACLDLLASDLSITADVIVATEVLEHLSEDARNRIISLPAKSAFFSVPNNRLGPDEEPQHTIKFTAKSFLDLLRRYFKHARVEVIDGYLLGVCGEAAQKNFTLSATFPCRDEEEDIERVLASLRGVADQLVVGIDPRTVDKTWEIAEQYCDLVFTLEDPEGVGEEKVPAGGVHFSCIRNQCISKCTGDWIFMTEGHEHLDEGQDVLLALDKLMPKGAKVGHVLRHSKGERWAFPWLFANDKRIYFKRSTHNILEYPEDMLEVRLPQVKTLHFRSRDKDIARAAQRKIQNRKTLMEDWVVNRNTNSLYYLGSEWRSHNQNKGIEWMEEFLRAPSKNGPARYHTRLMLAKEYMETRNDRKAARAVLLGCAADDWSRTDHYLWLGDLAFESDMLEEAYQWYRLAASRLGDPPFSMWWIDLATYSYLPAQRLAVTLASLGKLQEALVWAKKVVDLLPEDAPKEVSDEAASVVSQIEEAIQ